MVASRALRGRLCRAGMGAGEAPGSQPEAAQQRTGSLSTPQGYQCPLPLGKDRTLLILGNSCSQASVCVCWSTPGTLEGQEGHWRHLPSIFLLSSDASPANVFPELITAPRRRLLLPIQICAHWQGVVSGTGWKTLLGLPWNEHTGNASTKAGGCFIFLLSLK